MKDKLSRFGYMLGRNIKVYFKDRLTFVFSLMTPLILVVLFLLFLRGVYEDSLVNSLPEGFELSKKVVNAFTGSWLFSSIMTTSCITIAFCSNMRIDDKLKKTLRGFEIAPISKFSLSLSYTISNFITTLLICTIVLVISFIYLAIVGWYLTFADVLIIVVDMLLTVIMGSLIISIVGIFINSQGALSGICTLVSSMYGFLCGAYMPISGMGKGIQNFVGFIPGTYSTVIFRQAYMNGILDEIGKDVPSQAVDAIRKGFDCEYYFFDNKVATWVMYVVVIVTIVALLAIYLTLNLKVRHKSKQYVNAKSGAVKNQ
ncbi:MAG: ABC transporter permease [Clostridia bacterium]|nr:ABC transporter permease [Clostridia bacterium]